MVQRFALRTGIVLMALAMVAVPARSLHAHRVTAARPACCGQDPTGPFTATACYDYNKCIAAGDYRPNERAYNRPMAYAWNAAAQLHWTRVSLPSGHFSGYIRHAACVTAYCMLVGLRSTTNPTDGPYSPLAFRWNKSGMALDTAPVNPPGAKYAAFSSVSCLAKNFCFAVGVEMTASATIPLTERYNGHTWLVVATPLPAGTQSNLTDISCVPARYLKNAWCQAVGTYRAQGATRSWAVAWNGTAWTREPVQNPTGSSVVALQSVSCRMIQCLAVGYWQEGKLKSPLSEHLSVHGGNRKWVFDPMTPRPGRGSAMFGSVSWLGPNVARAAGTYFDVKHHVWHTLIEDWQDKWRLNGPADCYYKCRTAVPNAPVKGNSILVSVSCLGGTCMAVGHDIQPGETSITKPLVLWLKHTEGYYWIREPSPALP